MRSSKSRSRSKSNRPRTLGNITNRVFDSSGPEGKVRGTPQQIIDKYTILARDAQLSNDRVNAENFLQHAEHYTRLLGEAQREMLAEQEARRQQDSQNQQRDQQQRERQPDRGDNQQPDLRDDRQENGRDGQRDDRRDDRKDTPRDNRRDRNAGRSEDAEKASEVHGSNDDDLGLVETPETRRPPRQRPARNKIVTPRSDVGGDAQPDVGGPIAEPKAAPVREGGVPERSPRKPRGPRKPKVEGPKDGAGNEAAE